MLGRGNTLRKRKARLAQPSSKLLRMDRLPILFNSTRRRQVTAATFRAAPQLRGTVYQCREYPNGVYIDDHGCVQPHHKYSGTIKSSSSRKRTRAEEEEQPEDKEEEYDEDEDEGEEEDEDEGEEEDEEQESRPSKRRRKQSVDDEDYDEASGSDDDDDEDEDDHEDDEDYDDEDDEDVSALVADSHSYSRHAQQEALRKQQAQQSSVALAYLRSVVAPKLNGLFNGCNGYVASQLWSRTPSFRVLWVLPEISGGDAYGRMSAEHLAIHFPEELEWARDLPEHKAGHTLDAQLCWQWSLNLSGPHYWTCGCGLRCSDVPLANSHNGAPFSPDTCLKMVMRRSRRAGQRSSHEFFLRDAVDADTDMLVVVENSLEEGDEDE